MPTKSIRDIPLHHQTVFLRADLNVPLDEQQRITEDARIKAVLPTIEYILQKEGKVVLASHLGRPKGKVVPEMRLQPVAKRLSELLGQSVHYVDECIGEDVEATKAQLQPGEVMLLENLRFYPQEEENDLHFAEQLAQSIDVYITDAFGALHRKHASTHALPSLIFDKGTGFLIEREIDALQKIIHKPEEPLVVVIGGIKISDKVEVIRRLGEMADVVLVGGGVANTFLKALGNDVGTSIVESDAVHPTQQSLEYVELAKELYKRFESEQPSPTLLAIPGVQQTKIQIPVDVVAAPSTDAGAPTRVIRIGKDQLPQGWMFLDIGPETRALYANILQKAKTIFWNGPVGLFEQEVYAEGCRVLAETIAATDAYTVLGGGDTEAVIRTFGLEGRFSHVSTGGGASLAYIAKGTLPGLEVL